MVCPDCGNETSSGQAFCTNCGAFVRSGFGKLLTPEPTARSSAFAVESKRITTELRRDEIEWEQIDPFSERNQTRNALWPTETVFAIESTEDVEISPDVVVVEPEFEDDQADDFFEQSLSGKIKREDLAEEETKPATAASTQINIPAPPKAQDFSSTMSIGFQTMVDVTIERDVRRSRLWRSIKDLAWVVAIGAIFGGGIAAGVWFERLPDSELPAISAVPPVITETVSPRAPAGMVYVPGGEFLMGSDDADPLSRPAHFVSVSPYFIDRTEVTNEQYRQFLTATGQVAPRSWKNGAYPNGEADHPVTGVTWYEAAEYAAWAGKRLPTESEWEFAARGDDGRRYPWGDDFIAAYANAGGSAARIRNVGEGEPSPFGVYDMAGNAWEWTSSDARPYPGGKEFPWSKLRLKIIRGGNWQSSERTSAAYFRGFYGAAGERDYSGTGFRCVKDVVKK